MKTKLNNVLFESMQKAQKTISSLSSKQKSTMEKEWDVEHAYYSSTLEGSRLDRQDFEKLAEKIS